VTKVSRPATVSIAMATCNGASYIAEQLESLRRQDTQPHELVVSDDASTDQTVDIIAEFAANAPFPVRIERNRARVGYRANFMKVAGLCGSEVIAFCDQDDVWLPHKLSVCLKAFESDDVLLAYHNATVVSADLKPLGTLARQAAPRRARARRCRSHSRYQAAN
jgi:glycosyltransferase involved in cell wall biosynthesis